MSPRSISDKVIAKLAVATLHDLGSIRPTDSQAYVLSLIKKLPWFYRVPLRLATVAVEFSSLPFRLQRFSKLEDSACQRFVDRVLLKAPLFPALNRLIRTFALMDYADRLASTKQS